MVEKFTRVQGPYPVRSRARSFLSWDNNVWSLTSHGEMESSNHFPLDVNSDDGGPWLMTKSEDTCSPAVRNDTLVQGPYTVGAPREGWNTLTTSAHPSDLELQGKGTTAIARCAPTNPSTNLLTLMGEIGREGIPAIIGRDSMKERTLIAKNSGSEYLNIEFGWKPLVSDLQSLARTVNDSATIWNAYKKGSGMKTRVGYHFPSEEDSKSYTGQHIPVPSGIFDVGFLQGTTMQYRSRKTWFKGAFKYYVPEPKGFSGKMDHWQSEASKLLGIRLTPDTVWNLSPWTWAMDWFANTGDLLTNVSNFQQDGLVLQYGYAMAEETLQTFTAAGTQGTSRSTTRFREQKRAKRIPANPYGFSATLSTLTGRQLAIIGALGLTKTQ